MRFFHTATKAVLATNFVWKTLLFALVFANVWAFVGKEALPPNGTGFHLVMMLIAAHVLGFITETCKLTNLFGMLLAGFIYGNALDIELDKTLTSTFRSLALMVILMRAGLHLDPNLIRKLSFATFRLAFGPLIVEIFMIALTSYFLFELPLSWAIMLGFVTAAVSAAVVIPEMIKLQEKNLGVDKGIPTLVMAAGSIDDVLAISGFSVCLGFAFSQSAENGFTGQLIWSFAKGPVEAVVGVFFGIVFGVLFWYVPRKHDEKTDNYNLHRLVMFLGMSMFMLFGSEQLNLSGAGPLSILVLSFVAALKWRSAALVDYQEECLKTLWVVLEHFLYVLIGSDVRLRDLQPELLLYGAICLISAMLLRTIASFAFTFNINLNFKEKLFIAIAWLPKATVQAAIGPVPLDHAKTEEEIHRGRIVLTVAVLSIILTAPPGAIAINFFSKILLNGKNGKKVEENDETAQSSNVQIAEMTNEES